ncbi:SDR family oxidoreductase [Brevibacillus sp. SYSU BS000544]|uniref:SDR family oxidoreductase n=1 Tax=Brevibacillus sp. SYSU BS000544 TaxID=3416443 RepID=UPI003CE50F8D
MTASEALFLVIGATGAQGGATARQLLDRGHRVRVLVRDPVKAKHFADWGAEVYQGDLSVPSSVEDAVKGVTAVFSVPILDMTDPESEYRNAVTLIQAAHRAGVRHFVQTSVAGTGDHKTMTRAGTGYWNDYYWESKWLIEEAVRNAGFETYTIFKPTLYMENFLPPMADFMYPDLRNGEILSAINPQTRLHMIAVGDIGAFAVSAFENPQTFAGKTIELAAEALTVDEIAAVLSDVKGHTIKTTTLSPEEARLRGRSLYREDEWLNEVGHHTPIGELAEYGLRLTTFREWAEKNAGYIIVR